MSKLDTIEICRNALLSGAGMTRTLVEMHDWTEAEAEAFIGANLEAIYKED